MMERVAIGMPCLTGQVMFPTMTSILACHGLFEQFLYSVECPDLSKARNTVVSRFMQSGCSRMVFVDSDMIFTRSDFQRLISHDLDVVSGAYRRKRMNQPEPIMWPTPSVASGLVQVERVPTGFLSIRRTVFERIAQTHGDRWYRQDGELQYDCFPNGLCVAARDGDGAYQWMGEDYSFCILAKAAGVEIWADLDCKVGHRGWFDFTVPDGSAQSHLQETR